MSNLANRNTQCGERGMGFYIHLPFCVHRCSYCDFFSSAKYEKKQFTAIAKGIQNEIRKLKAETESKGWVIPPLTSVFIGGGTPSLFAVEDIEELLRVLSVNFSISPNAEITMEANPETLSKEYLQALKKHTPINRISMGAQSFHKKHLATLERRCQPRHIYKAVEDLKSVGFDNFNLDLIFAIPNQTLKEVLKDIETAIKQEPKHISFYQLTLGKDHKLYSQLPDEDFQATAYEEGVRRLEFSGFDLYEISNFSQAGLESRHNMLYWVGGDYFGVGPSANSRVFVDGVFWHRKQVADTKAYDMDKSPDLGAWELCTPSQTTLEAGFLELRTSHGIRTEDFENRYGYDLRTSPKLLNFIYQGWMAVDTEKIYMTPKGRLFADGIARDLIN